MPICFDESFRWLNPLVKAGSKRELGEDDIYANVDSMSSAKNTDAFANEWQMELEKKDPSIIRVILKLHGYKVLLVTFVYAILATLAG